MALLKLLFSFKGRISRSTFWITKFFVGLTFVAFLYFVDWCYKSTQEHVTTAGSFLEFILVVAFIWCYAIVYVKRWHDRNKSGAMFFIIFIPIAGQIWSLVELGLLPGTDGPNNYGEDPLLPVQVKETSAATVAFNLLSSGDKAQNQGDLAKARAIYNEVISTFPHSDAAGDARIALVTLDSDK